MKIDLLLAFVFLWLAFMLGAGIATPSHQDRKILDLYEAEYKNCIYQLPRNSDCYLSGMKFAIKDVK